MVRHDYTLVSHDDDTAHWPLRGQATTQERLDDALATVRRLREQLKREAIPKEPERGTVITFDKGSYNFAALRAGNGRWYTTGCTCPRAGFEWPDLWAFIHSNGEWAQIRIMTENGDTL